MRPLDNLVSTMVMSTTTMARIANGLVATPRDVVAEAAQMRLSPSRLLVGLQLLFPSVCHIDICDAGNKHWDVSMSRCKPFLHFVGQEALLNSLEEALLPTRSNQAVTGRRFVLRGLSGSGKTQVALRFAEQHRQS